MTPALHIRIASVDDADEIAQMSRDLIETGLPWTWRPERVSRAINADHMNVAVAHEHQTLIAFGIMEYWDEDAHLVLFAVRPSSQRQGIGTSILNWLEHSAIVSGAQKIRVESRQDNIAGRSFYNEHGYHELKIKSRMYSGRLNGIQLEKWLATNAPSDA